MRKIVQQHIMKHKLLRNNVVIKSRDVVDKSAYVESGQINTDSNPLQHNMLVDKLSDDDIEVLKQTLLRQPHSATKRLAYSVVYSILVYMSVSLVITYAMGFNFHDVLLMQRKEIQTLLQYSTVGFCAQIVHIVVRNLL